jgi:hypothetical protein
MTKWDFDTVPKDPAMITPRRDLQRGMSWGPGLAESLADPNTTDRNLT